MSNVKGPAYMKSLFSSTVAMGDKAIASDAYFEIEGYEELGLLIKQFPWPQLSIAGEIEVPTPNGGTMWQPQNIRTAQQGPVTLMETEAGHIQAFLENVIGEGGRFNAKVYEGTPDDYKRIQKIRSCFFVLDTADRDWENRAQILQISGTLFFHYFANQ